ncbi:hypothetical protein [Sphingomonas sp. M1-B02]|uniref:hypothetical protein n=1 Tax=Sphingomonas sp. M1-B02 TaxID=3114300 RepID=UPI00223F1B76|nr:hypothetical protein [Sphingomonas sp. S6-11]UZK67793.1 DUF485 domain-containing protein [Sphingomonas sp. S6-11]
MRGIYGEKSRFNLCLWRLSGIALTGVYVAIANRRFDIDATALVSGRLQTAHAGPGSRFGVSKQNLAEKTEI